MESKSLKLIQAVAAGDAKREDVVAALKADGVDALDVLIDVLASASRGRVKPRPLNFFDPQRASRERVKSIHQVPYYPFMLNGTLYDPADVKRFDGQELHFIGGSPNSSILAIDDPEVVDLWVKHTYIDTFSTTSTQSLADRLAAQLHGYDDGMAVSTTSSPHTTTVSNGGLPPPGPGPIGPGLTPAYGGPPRTIFFEDVDYGGSDLELNRNRGYYDLTEVPWTFLGTGDWNDEISSFVTTIPLWTRLWEHVRWTGSSYTVYGGSENLTYVGWNDRASSVETW